MSVFAGGRLDAVAERIEQELARVRAARPGNQALASRISRAENLLVTHLSCRRNRVIRVRVRDGRARFLVSGSSGAGAVYVVDPASWACSCPDHHRRGAGCKHSLACWALWRAQAARPAFGLCDISDRSDQRGTCAGLEHVGEIVGRAVPALRPCSSCAGAVPSEAGEVVEVGPQEAEWSLAVSEGDVLCRSCARRHGVL